MEAEVGIADMIEMSGLDEAALLENLRCRFSADLIYTSVGSILVSVNPYKILPVYTLPIVKRYSGQRLGALSPHLFAIAEDCFANMVADNKNQSVIISGESGAGKTEATKMIMAFLSARSTKQSAVERKMMESNPILEAFGNAKTVRNDNSSRFGKFMEIRFNDRAEICGGRITQYLLEKSRLVYQTESERNYHVFYQLLAAPTKEKDKFWLGAPSDYWFTNQSGCVSIDGVDDKEGFETLVSAFNTLGFSQSDRDKIFSILASVLHLGNVRFKRTGDGKKDDSTPEDLQVVQRVATLLSCPAPALHKALCQRVNVIRGEKFEVALTATEATSNRNALAKYMYGTLFSWLVDRINALIEGRDACSSIGVLDIFGFENFKVNSFEQFNINFTNEKLQQFFNQRIFKQEQQEYDREGINWSTIAFKDNQECVDLVEKPMGLISLLDEECRFPKGTDVSLLEKLHANLAKQPSYEAPRISKTTFVIKHYAGDVSYEIEGFLAKNKDTTQQELLELLQNSTDPFISEVFAAPKEPPIEELVAVPATPRGTSTLKKKAGAGTVATKFKEQLIALVDTLAATAPHYVRCLKPNLQKVADVWDEGLVMAQLKYAGMMETVRIRQLGYPIRWPFEAFYKRYRSCALVPASVTDPKAKCQVLLKAIAMPEDQFQLGHSKLFMKDSQRAVLEEKLGKATNIKASVIQRAWRGSFYRRQFLRKRKATLLFQACFRRYEQSTRYAKTRRLIIVIQSDVRRHQKRSAFLAKRKSAVVLQKVWRGRTARKAYVKFLAEHKAELARRAAQAEAEAKAAAAAAAAKAEAEARAAAEAEAKAAAAALAAATPTPVPTPADASTPRSAAAAEPASRERAPSTGWEGPSFSLRDIVLPTPRSRTNSVSFLSETAPTVSPRPRMQRSNSGVAAPDGFGVGRRASEDWKQALEKSARDLQLEQQKLEKEVDRSRNEMQETGNWDEMDALERELTRMTIDFVSQTMSLSGTPPPAPAAAAATASSKPSDQQSAGQQQQQTAPVDVSRLERSVQQIEAEEFAAEAEASRAEAMSVDFNLAPRRQSNDVPLPSPQPEARLRDDRPALTSSQTLPGPPSSSEFDVETLPPPPPLADLHLPPPPALDLDGLPVTSSPTTSPGETRTLQPSGASETSDSSLIGAATPTPEIVEDVEVENYKFSSWAVKHFRQKKGTKNTELFSWSKSDFKAPLLERLKGPSAKVAQEVAAKVQSYMTDKKTSDPYLAPRFILQKGLAHEELRDEIYSQLIKQVTNNPSADSTVKGWELINFCANTFAASEDFSRFVAAFMMKTRDEHKRDTALRQQRPGIYEIAVYACHGLKRTVKNGPRKMVPTPADLEAIKAKRYSLVKIRFMDDSEKGFYIDAASTAKEACATVRIRMGLVDASGYALFSVYNGIARRLPDAERIADAIAKSEAMQKAMLAKKQPFTFNLLFKRSCFIPVKTKFSDSADLHLTFSQAWVDYLSYTVKTDEEQACALGACRVHFDVGDYPAEAKGYRITYVPRRVAKASTMGPAEWKKRITRYHLHMVGMTKDQAKERFLELISVRPLYGATTFECTTHGFDGNPLGVPGSLPFIIAVDPRGIHSVDNVGDVAKTFAFDKLASWTADEQAHTVTIKFTPDCETPSIALVSANNAARLAAVIDEHVEALRQSTDLFRAVRDHIVLASGLLSFSKGDLIRVRDRAGRWWTGEINGRVGSFPAECVEAESIGASFAPPPSRKMSRQRSTSDTSIRPSSAEPPHPVASPTKRPSFSGPSDQQPGPVAQPTPPPAITTEAPTEPVEYRPRSLSRSHTGIPTKKAEEGTLRGTEKINRSDIFGKASTPHRPDLATIRNRTMLPKTESGTLRPRSSASRAALLETETSQRPSAVMMSVGMSDALSRSPDIGTLRARAEAAALAEDPSNLENLPHLRRDKRTMQRAKSSANAVPAAATVVFGVDPLKESILELSGNLSRIAKEAFIDAMKFMGDYPSKGLPDYKLAQSFIQHGLDNPGLHDELFAQLFKQLTGNPRRDSVVRGWGLLALLCAYWPPSAELELPLRTFLNKQVEGSDPQIKQYAEICLDRVMDVRTLGPRRCIPSEQEVTSVLQLQRVICRVHLLDGTSKGVYVHSSTTVRRATQDINSKIGIDERHGFSLFQQGPDDDVPVPLADGDYVCDHLSMWDVLAAARGTVASAYKFVFKQRVGIAGEGDLQLANDNPVAFNLIYYQVAFDLRQSRLPVPTDLWPQLAVCQFVAGGGDASRPPSKEQLLQYLPENVRERAAQTDDWATVAKFELSVGKHSTSAAARLAFIRALKPLPMYGASVFEVTLKEKPVWLVVNHAGLEVHEPLSESALQSWPHDHINSYESDARDEFHILTGSLMKPQKTSFVGYEAAFIAGTVDAYRTVARVVTRAAAKSCGWTAKDVARSLKRRAARHSYTLRK